MKKACLILLFLISATCLKAQINEQYLVNSWIKVKTTFNDNAELPDGLVQKYSYTKYTFSNAGKINICIKYNSSGSGHNYYINDSILNIVNANRYPVNELKIVKLDAGEMVLVQKGQTGFGDSSALKMYFIPETAFQNKARFTKSDIEKLANGDTVYHESPKVHAQFKGSEDLSAFIYGRGESTNMDQQKGYLKASFIILRSGEVDSFKIENGINNDYDKQVVKWFTKNKKNWAAAMFKGKAVNVKRVLEMRYFTSKDMTPYMRFNGNGNNALNNGDYKMALYFYTEALKYLPNNTETIYKNVSCKIALGIGDGLCDDIANIAASGTMLVDSLADKYCQVEK